MSDLTPNRRQLTFSQAEGLAPIPGQFEPRLLPPSFRARVWKRLYNDLHNTRTARNNFWAVSAAWHGILIDFFVEVFHADADAIPYKFDKSVEVVKAIITKRDYNEVFDFLQFVVRHRDAPHGLAFELEELFVDCGTAYILVDGDTIVQKASDEEAKALQQAVEDLSLTEFHGARSHLKRAATALTAGNYPDVVRESIHAVDGVARALAPGSKDLTPALDALQAAGYIHKAMRDGFSKLYGYASNEKGIRHALIENGEARVTEADAIYMLGSCSAFVSYLIRTGRDTGLLH